MLQKQHCTLTSEEVKEDYLDSFSQIILCVYQILFVNPACKLCEYTSIAAYCVLCWMS